MKLVPLVGPEDEAQHELVRGDDVVLPDHGGNGADPLGNVTGFSARQVELVDDQVAERPEVGSQLLGSDLLQNLLGNSSRFLHFGAH